MLSWSKKTNKITLHSTKTKGKLYKTLIRPVLLYGCETWAINGSNEDKVATFERKVLRKIHGPICDNGRWRIRYNNELYQLFREPDIIKDIKARNVRWLEHLFRTTENHPYRKLTFTTLHSAERVGRPPTRWLELRKIGVGIWKRVAMDRGKWRSIIGAVKAGTRL
jgi:hypothetical protein